MPQAIHATVPQPLKLPELPEVVNHTPWPAQNFVHVDPAGDAFHVLVCRITYTLRGMQPDSSGLPQPVLLPGQSQPPLVTADEYEGALNCSSVVQESDFAPYKPLCDVLLINAHAHAPNGQAAARWSVGLRFGDTFSKVLHVTGPRHYERSGPGGWRLLAPRVALKVPLSYQLAYGGPNVVAAHMQAEKAATPDAQQPPPFYYPNPIGCGRLGGKDTQAWIASQSARMVEQLRHGSDPRPQTDPDLYFLTEEGAYRGPQIESPEQPFDGEERDYPVMGFGPVARWWQPRLQLAGTHDDEWKATQWPKSPKDHDYRYWNCAPDDQQIPYPDGGETITLANLTPPLREGDRLVSRPVSFALPDQSLSALVRMRAGPLLLMPMAIDTVVINVGEATLSVVRRALIPGDLDVRKLELGTWRPNDADAAATISVPSAQPGSN